MGSNFKAALIAAQLTFISVSMGVSQTIIWSEDFSGYANGTTTGANKNTANSAVDWTTSCSGCNLSNEFKATSGGVFNINNTDVNATWTSETIDISAYTNISVTINVDADDDQLDGTDCVSFFYNVGTGLQSFTTNGSICDDNNGITIASVSGLSGTSLVITFVGITTQTNEDINIQSIEVVGELLPTITLEPCIFDFTKTIKVLSTSVQGGANLIDYPLLISTTDTDLRNGIQHANGYDISFYDPISCSFIPHQLEYYDNSTGEIIVWVKVPTLYSGVETIIEMYYGCSEITYDVSSTDTWDNDYMGVWHFGNTIDDGTINGLNLSDNNTSNFANSKIGQGRELDNGTNINSNSASGAHLTLPSNIFGGVSDFTFEGWVYLDRDNTNWERVFDFGSNTTENFFFTISTGTNSPEQTRARITTGGNGSEQGTNLNNPSAVTGAWHYWAVRLNSTSNSLEVFRDGALVSSATGVTTEPRDMEPSSGNYFGKSQYTADHKLDGKFDEFRISTSVRTNGWIQTTYSNQNNPVNFYEIGDQNLACDTLYSIQTGDWNTVGNWSLTSAGCSCECVPKGGDTSTVFIEGNDIISLTGADEIHSLVIGTFTGAGAGPGTLQWAGSFDLDIFGTDGAIDVRSNGSLDRNGNAAWSIDFDNTSGASYTFNNDGFVDIHELDLGDATLTMSGSSNIRIRDDVNIRANNAVMTNNNTATVLIEDDMDFNNFTTTVNNNGTIDLDGEFTDVDAGEVIYYNFAGSVTNYAGNPGLTDADMQIDANYNSNTFEYDRNGAQNIITSHAYWHLILSKNGNKDIYNGVLDVNGDLTMLDNAVVNANDAGDNITLAGNWINTATVGFAGGNQSVTFDGAVDQYITSTGGETYNDLIIGNSGNVVYLNDNVSLSNSGTLSFATPGYLALNTHDLTIPFWSAGDITGYGPDAFIIVDQTGQIKTTGVGVSETVVFPMGLSAGATNLAIAEVTNLDPANTTFDANLCDYVSVDGTCSGGTEVIMDIVDYTYNITSGSNSALVKLFWHSSKEMTNFDRTQCRVMHHNGLIWDFLSLFLPSTDESGTVGANYFSVVGPTTGFSPFAVEDNAIPLPVELISFEADIIGSQSLLTWATATEENNSHFIVQRSKDGINDWNDIGKVQGSGNTSGVVTYSFVDESPLNGHNYYRLIQVDFDGTKTATPIDWVLFDKENGIDFVIFPNPTYNTITVRFNSAYEGEVSIQLIDVKGRILMEIGQEHLLSEKIDMSELPAATYILKIIHENDVFIEKIVKH